MEYVLLYYVSQPLQQQNSLSARFENCNPIGLRPELVALIENNTADSRLQAGHSYMRKLFANGKDENDTQLIFDNIPGHQ